MSVSNRTKKPVLAFMGLLFFVVFSYFGYALVTSQIAQTRVAELFQPVNAIVISSHVISRSPMDLRGSRTYGVAITYRYKVASQDYRSHRYSYMFPGFKDYTAAKKVADQYSTGDRITAYYDPKNPADSVIYKNTPELPAALLAFPFALFALIGLIMFIYGLRWKSGSGK